MNLTKKSKQKRNKVFIISDTHFPFHSVSAYKKMLKALKNEMPTHVVQIGDLLDMYVFSNFTRTTEITVEDDIREGLKYAKKMWNDVQTIVPKAKCVQILGNHDMRLAKRIAEKLPELSELIKITDLYTFPNVEVIASDKQHYTIDNVNYIHGYLSKSIDHAKHFNGPVVHGHLHRPSITYDSASVWSMDVGYLADRTSLPLSYTQTKVNKWTMAVGIVDNGAPRLIILE